MSDVPASPAARLAIVIVTYNRSTYLADLLRSATALTVPPWRIVVVDNASTDDTPDVVAEAAGWFPEGVLVDRRLDTNTGGSGGFCEGTRTALELGAEWVWLMDDDVEILPEALERFAPAMERFRVIHGRRYDFDGSPFYWQAKFNQFLGVPLPYGFRRTFDDEGYAITNSGTFEGMLIHADVVRTIGLPDPRFFITWDDAAYAWLAAQHTDVVYMDAFVLQRKREQQQVNLGVRHLNDGSPLFRSCLFTLIICVNLVEMAVISTGDPRRANATTSPPSLSCRRAGVLEDKRAREAMWDILPSQNTVIFDLVPSTASASLVAAGGAPKT